jgi:integrase
MINLRKRGDAWQADFRYDCPVTGTRRRHRAQSPHPTKRESHEWAVQIKAQLEAPAQERPKEPMRFKEFAEVWLSDYSAIYCKPSTHNVHRWRINAHFNPAFGELKLDEINAHHIARFTAELGAGLKRSTVRVYVQNLQAMLRRAVRWELLERVPVIDIPTSQPVAWTYLEDDELERLIAAAAHEPKVATLIPVLAHTGIRIGEALALRWDRVDFVRQELTIELTHSAGYTMAPKNGKRRTVPLNASAIAALKAQRVQTYMRDGLVWAEEDGSQPTLASFRSAWKRSLRAAGVRYVRVHDLRHTFASRLVQRGVTLQTVRDLLGHSDISTTLRYAHLAPSNLQSAVSQLEEFGHKMVTSGDLVTVTKARRGA